MIDDLVGQNLGQYQIRMVLGKGGMSTVYLAYQPSMDRTVAIKVLPPAFLHDSTFLARFQQEVRTIARLEHLHILPVYDVGQDRGIPYMVMRYLSGGTLADQIHSRLPNLSTVVRIVGQVAEALDYAHARGIIHRDMKPSNILLDTSGNAYLADFGIARVAEAATHLTGSRVIGTPPYIAPEMIRKGEEVTHSVDIYALGIITFEMLTGSPPYEDEDPTKVLMAHVLEPVPSVRAVDPNISPEIDAVVQRCLAKNSYGRYASAGEFAYELARAAQPGRVVAPPPRRPEPVEEATHRRAEAAVETTPDEAEPTPTRSGVGCLIVTGVALAMLVAILVSAWVLTDGNPASLLTLLAPLPTRIPQPTVTATLSGDVASPIPTTTLPLQVLPPPASGDRLAFASNRDGDFEIFLIEVDGSNLVQLTRNVAADFDPAWSPDGSQIVYASSTDGDAEIKIMYADGSDVRQLTDNAATDFDPDWSPDGQWIAFSSNQDGDFELYVMRTDGSDARQLTFNDVDDYNPRWSPDGSRILYYVKVEGNSDLYVIDANGGRPYQLTNAPELEQWPDWSPDGLRIAYTSAVGLPEGRRAIFVLDLSTNVSIQITVAEGRDDDPAWSYDGTRLAFDSDRNGSKFDLYIYNVVSGQLQRLTSDAGDNVAPAWQPPTP